MAASAYWQCHILIRSNAVDFLEKLEDRNSPAHSDGRCYKHTKALTDKNIRDIF